jgi:hypothetical protein
MIYFYLFRHKKTPPFRRGFFIDKDSELNSAIQQSTLGYGVLDAQSLQIPAEILISGSRENIFCPDANVFINFINETADGLISKRPTAAIRGGDIFVQTGGRVFVVRNIHVVE